ncbi:MAG TPA: carboxypeptidase-like regulatory domain-containing protein, partial [Bacteroidota bacterium]|nr:carboxypeptidase-like regulatory domain-containing protein [Bacteroidota bacterium]
MRKFHFIFFIFFFGILNSPEILSQQSILLHGAVFDNTSGEPLPTANIRIAGTSLGTISNLRGNYSLTLDSGKYVI